MTTLALIMSVLVAQTPQHRLFMQPNLPRTAAISYAFFEFAPASGAGMGAACAGTTPTGSKGEALTFPARTTVAECYSNDGQSLTQVTSIQPRVSSGAVDSTVVGLWQEIGRQNDLLRCRDGSDAVWVKTSMTCARTANGMRNADANGATTCTASGANGTVIQSITRTSQGHATSVHLKRRTGTGTVALTVDNGASWLDITASLSSTLWKRAVPFETPGCTALTGSLCIVVSGLSLVSANPAIGLRLGTSGDAVDLDFWQNEASTVGTATSPIETAGVAVPRGNELPDMAIAPVLPAGFCVSSTAVSQLISLSRPHGVPGSGAPGSAGGSASYADSYYSTSWVAETSVTTPFSSTTGVTTASVINRATTFYAAGTLNGCLNGVCGAGTAATWSAPTWTRFRLAGYDASGPAINGVIKQVQLDPDGTRCGRSL